MKWIPKILSLVFLWGSIILIIVFVEPELLRDVLIPNSYLPFFGLLTIALWYTLALITRFVVGGLILTLTIVGSLVLMMLQLMHWGLAVVLLLTFVMESWYIYHRHEKIHSTNEQKD